jgi:hypothetical protein
MQPSKAARQNAKGYIPATIVVLSVGPTMGTHEELGVETVTDRVADWMRSPRVVLWSVRQRSLGVNHACGVLACGGKTGR